MEPSATNIEMSVNQLDMELYRIERQLFRTMKHPSDYQEVVIELGEKWREKTVEDLMQLQVRISCLKSFGGGHMPFLKETKSSSVLVILTLPQHLFPLDFRQKALHDFLRSEDVLKVIIDGQCVLDLEKMVSFLFTGHSVT